MYALAAGDGSLSGQNSQVAAPSRPLLGKGHAGGD
jgi:hypothetical protein